MNIKLIYLIALNLSRHYYKDVLSGADNERCVIIVRQELNARLVIRSVNIMCNPLIYPNLAHYLEGNLFENLLPRAVHRQAPIYTC